MGNNQTAPAPPPPGSPKLPPQTLDDEDDDHCYGCREIDGHYYDDDGKWCGPAPRMKRRVSEATVTYTCQCGEHHACRYPVSGLNNYYEGMTMPLYCYLCAKATGGRYLSSPHTISISYKNN